MVLITAPRIPKTELQQEADHRSPAIACSLCQCCSFGPGHALFLKQKNAVSAAAHMSGHRLCSGCAPVLPASCARTVLRLTSVSQSGRAARSMRGGGQMKHTECGSTHAAWTTACHHHMISWTAVAGLLRGSILRGSRSHCRKLLPRSRLSHMWEVVWGQACPRSHCCLLPAACCAPGKPVAHGRKTQHNCMQSAACHGQRLRLTRVVQVLRPELHPHGSLPQAAPRPLAGGSVARGRLEQLPVASPFAETSF